MSEWYIAHSAGAWKKHKYIKKIGEGPKALYFYTQKQLSKWMKRKTENETTKKGLESEGTENILTENIETENIETENIETNDRRKKEQYFAKQRRRDYHDEKDRKEDLRRYAINNQTGDVERAKEAYTKGRNSQALLNGIRRNGRTYNDDRQEAYEIGKQLMNDNLKKKAIRSQNSNHQERAKIQAKEIENQKKRSKAVNKQTGSAVDAREAEKRKKQAEATEKRIQKGLEAARMKALKTGDLPTPYKDEENGVVDVAKYKNMKFTPSELKRIKRINRNLWNLTSKTGTPSARDNYADSLSQKDLQLLFSYNRKQIAEENDFENKKKRTKAVNKQTGSAVAA